MAKNNKNEEKRKYARIEVDAYVSAILTTDKARVEKIFTTKDISPQGVFLISAEAFPVGTVLPLKIHTPTTLEPINTEARVIRIARDKDLRITGMGLAFMQITEKDEKELLKHLYLSYHYTEHK